VDREVSALFNFDEVGGLDVASVVFGANMKKLEWEVISDKLRCLGILMKFWELDGSIGGSIGGI
jgi:hypothetical protein